mmetsp:Transcript_51404/g.95051  ORF Transcript_51404/g.95051 Transcript_51404/m.95051 type:complete len:132 (-) Transcript_51404:35-430(-)
MATGITGSSRTAQLSNSRSVPGLALDGSAASAAPPLTFTTGLERSNRIPTCFSSHKAMAKLFDKSPELFTEGARSGATQGNFYTVQDRHLGNTSKASVRKTMLGVPDAAARARTSRSLTLRMQAHEENPRA